MAARREVVDQILLRQPLWGRLLLCLLCGCRGHAGQMAVASGAAPAAGADVLARRRLSTPPLTADACAVLSWRQAGACTKDAVTRRAGSVT